MTEKLKRKRLAVSLAVAFCILLGAGLYTWCTNQFTLELRLVGEQTLIIEYGNTYEECGATAHFWGTKFLRKGFTPEVVLTISSNVSENKLGTYEVLYHATYYNFVATATRTVQIVDTVAPVIELDGDFQNGEFSNMNYQEERFHATDNYDGDITDKVIREVSEGKILYTVSDSSGNITSAERSIPEVHSQEPSIWLREGEHIQIPCGIPFSDPGAVAWDETDGDLTQYVSTEGEVLWYLPGTYSIIYSIIDSEGNEVQATRTVEVAAHSWPEEIMPEGKTIYLTFDDGPGPYTPILLDILDRYDVKATFFVVDSGRDDILRKIAARGHTIGIHSMTHKYESIYESPEAYFADLYGMQDKIFQITGIRPYILRFPGGGSNTISMSNPGIMSLLTKAVRDAGFQYFDWNVDSNDAGGAQNERMILENMISGIKGQAVSVVLQHDTHLNTIYAVEDLIVWGLENGYTFLPLEYSSPAFHHDVRN